MNSLFRIILIAVLTCQCVFQAKAQNITVQKQKLVDQYNTVIKGYRDNADSANKPILDSAIRILNRLEKLDSTEIWVYQFRARLYYDKSINKDDYALKDINHAIRLNDTCFSCYTWRAYYFDCFNNFKKSKCDSALKDMNRALELNDSCFDCYSWRAYYYMYMYNANNNYKKKSAEDFSRLVAMDSSYFTGYLELYHLASSDNDEAVRIRKYTQAHFRRLVDADSTNARSWYLLGKAYNMRPFSVETNSNNQKCLYAFSKATELDSTKVAYLYQRGLMLYFFKKDYKASIKDMQKVIDLDGDQQSWEFIELAYRDMGDYQSALDTLNKGIELHPDYYFLEYDKKELLKKMAAKGITPKK